MKNMNKHDVITLLDKVENFFQINRHRIMKAGSSWLFTLLITCRPQEIHVKAISWGDKFELCIHR